MLRPALRAAALLAILQAGCAPAGDASSASVAVDDTAVASAAAPAAGIPDSVARTALDGELRALFALDAVLAPERVRTRPASECGTVRDERRQELRRTFHATDDAGDTRLVYVRATSTDSSPKRVEVVRKPAGGAQYGAAWNASDDAVVLMGLDAGALGADSAGTRRAVAGALRHVARTTLALPCADAGA